MNRHLPSGLLLPGLASLALACGPADAGSGDLGGAGAAEEEEAVADSRSSPADTAAPRTSTDPVVADSADPFAGFELPSSGEAGRETRRVRLLLRNAAADLAVVYADGGAGEVLLDSVEAGVDVRVDVLTRAPTVALRSISGEGAPLRETEVAAGVDSVLEVVVGRAPPAP